MSRWQTDAKHREACNRYRNSDKGRATRKAYESRPEVKARRKQLERLRYDPAKRKHKNELAKKRRNSFDGYFRTQYSYMKMYAKKRAEQNIKCPVQWQSPDEYIDYLRMLCDYFWGGEVRCIYTNLPLVLSGSEKVKNKPSPQRIIPDKGYVAGNVFPTTWEMNRLMGLLTPQLLAKALATQRKINAYNKHFCLD